jgi:hypothetical protein
MFPRSFFRCTAYREYIFYNFAVYFRLELFEISVLLFPSSSTRHLYCVFYIFVQITIAIGDEVKEQNRALEHMQNGMGSTDNLLSSTLGKMKVES